MLQKKAVAFLKHALPEHLPGVFFNFGLITDSQQK
jgi:hypothetical protein